VIAQLPTHACLEPDGRTKRVVHQGLALFNVCRTIVEECDPGTEFRDRERFRHDHRLRFLCSQEVDDGFAAVCAARAADLMELWVQQFLQAFTTAPNARVVKFDFERLEFLKKVVHGQCALCGRTFDSSGLPKAAPPEGKLKCLI